MIVADTTIPPSTYPRQPYQVLGWLRRRSVCGPDCAPLANGGCDCPYVTTVRGLGNSDTNTIIGTVLVAGAALFAIHHFIRKPYRRGRAR